MPQKLQTISSIRGDEWLLLISAIRSFETLPEVDSRGKFVVLTLLRYIKRIWPPINKILESDPFHDATHRGVSHTTGTPPSLAPWRLLTQDVILHGVWVL